MTRVRMKIRTKGGTNEKKKEAGEEKTGRREAAGSHGTLEMDAGQSKRFLQKNNSTLEGAITELGWQVPLDWSST